MRRDELEIQLFVYILCIRELERSMLCHFTIEKSVSFVCM